MIASETQTERISIDGLTIHRNRRPIVKNLSCAIRAGEMLGLIGPNGAGKSTLMATLAGIDTADTGSIHVDGRPIGTYSPEERARCIGWVEQLGTVHWPLTVERLVMLGRIPHLAAWGKPTETDHAAVEHALAQADCLELRHRRVPTLSGGERARVLLARAVAAEPSVLLADEPVSSLDLSHQLQTMQLLREYAAGTRVVVVVLHDLSLAVRYCDRLLLMHKGEQVAMGEPAAVLSNANIARVYGVSVITGCESVPWVVPEHVLPPILD